MCCHTYVSPIPPNWHEIVQLAGFKLNNEREDQWRRDLPGYRSIFVVPHERKTRDGMPDDYLIFWLSPPIGDHTEEAHVRHQASASILFEVARVCAEQNNASMWQGELRGVCKDELTPEEVKLDLKHMTTYPRPLQYQDLCFGFRLALERGAAQLYEEEKEAEPVPQKVEDVYYPPSYDDVWD